MWHSGSAQGQGGIVENASGVPTCGAPMNQGREEGARPKIASPTIDCKSIYDSHNDSGFVSGSNLVSSSSLGCDEPSSMRSEDVVPGEAHHGIPDPKTQGHSCQGILDSGIDISEQLSSLHLASPNTSGSTASDTGELSSPIRRPVTPPPRPSRLGLNEAQVALLQEIFQTDEDGDT